MLSPTQTTILTVLLFTVLTPLPAEADNVTAYSFQNKSRNFEHLHELISTFVSENACTPIDPASSLLSIIPWGFDSIFDMKVFSALTLDTGHEEAGIMDSNESIRMRPICNMLWVMKWMIINEEITNSLKENYTYDKGGHDEHVTDRMLFLHKGIVISRGFLILVIAYLVVFRIVAFMRYLHRVRTTPSKDLLKKLPIHKYKTGDPYDVCPICLAEYEEEDKLRVLPCSHAYHSECVDHWLTNKKRTCPFCTQKVENKM